MENTENTTTAYTLDNLTKQRVEWARSCVNEARWIVGDTKRVVELLDLFKELFKVDNEYSGRSIQQAFKLMDNAAPFLTALERSHKNLDKVDDILLGYERVDGVDDDNE